MSGTDTTIHTPGPLTVTGKPPMTETRAARDVLAHPAWERIGTTLDRYSRGEISDLVALGLIGNAFYKLDEARLAGIERLDRMEGKDG